MCAPHRLRKIPKRGEKEMKAPKETYRVGDSLLWRYLVHFTKTKATKSQSLIHYKKKQSLSSWFMNYLSLLLRRSTRAGKPFDKSPTIKRRPVLACFEGEESSALKELSPEGKSSLDVYISRFVSLLMYLCCTVLIAYSLSIVVARASSCAVSCYSLDFLRWTQKPRKYSILVKRK